MQQYIYVDILLTVNFIIDYFLLRLTALLTGQHVSGKRTVLSAILASFTSLMIFVPALPQFTSVLIDLIFSGIISYLAFGYTSLYRYILRTVTFYGVNLIYAGGILLLCFTLKPDNLLFYHRILYFPMSPILLILFATVLYFGVKLFHLSLKNGRIIEKTMTIHLTHKGVTLHLKGYTDTGNHAFDLYTGTPVIFCTAVSLKPLIGDAGIRWIQHSGWLSETGTAPDHLRLRLLPLRFAGGDNMLPAFVPDKLEAESSDGTLAVFRATVAIVPYPFREGYDILLHPELSPYTPNPTSTAERQGIL